MEEEEVPQEEEEDEEVTADERSNDPDPAFARLRRHYYGAVNEMQEDPSLSRYLDHFHRMYEYLEFTRDEAMELEFVKRNLDVELAMNTERLNNSLHVIENDENYIEKLKAEITTSLKLIENAHNREQSAQEIIDNLRKQIANLNMEIDFKNKMAQGELEENPAAAKHREKLEREKAKLISEVSKLSEKLTNALAYQEELERRTSITDLRINDISTQLEETEVEVEKYKRIKEKLETDLDEYHDELMRKEFDLEALNQQMNVNQKLMTKYEGQIKEQTNSANKCFKELEMWNARFFKMQEEFESLHADAEKTKVDNYRAVKALRLKDEERGKFHFEFSKVLKERERADLKARLIEASNMTVVEDNRKLHEVVASMQKDYELQELERAQHKIVIDEHVKERDILNRNLLRQQAVGRDHLKVMKVQDQIQKKLDIEIDSHIIQERKQAKEISQLEKERDRLLEESLDKTKRMNATLDEIRLQNIFINDLKKNLADSELKYKAKQNLFDAVRADRNALQKTLQECTSENNELKERLKVCHRQSEQLKEEIGVKEQMLSKGDAVRRKIIKEKENIKIELNANLDQVRLLKSEIAERTVEERRLYKVVQKSLRLINEQAKTITALMNERDVLGSQLVRRNDEISLVNEKIKIIQTTLHRGEAQYDERLNDIKLLKVEIKRLRQEGLLLTKSIGSMTDFKVEVFHLERELTKERMKSKALETELHNPMNIKRWRKLDGTDPEMPELLTKATLLQKRLLGQAVTMVEVEKKLKEAEKGYLNLRLLVSKQPGQKVQDSYNKSQKALFTSTLRNKCLISELNMLEVNNRQCRQNLAVAETKLDDIKQKFKQEKEKNDKRRQLMMSAADSFISKKTNKSQKSQRSQRSHNEAKSNDSGLSSMVVSVSKLSK